MIKKLVFFLLTIFKFYLPAQLLGSYGFSAVTPATGTIDPTAPPLAIGLTFGPFTAVGTSSNPSASQHFSFSDWPLGAIDANDSLSSMTGNLDTGTYYQVDLIPVFGYSLNLSAINFIMRRSGTGIRNYAVRSSMDAYSNNLPASVSSNTKISVIAPNVFLWNYDAAPNTSDQKGSAITLAGPSFSNITNVLSFRFYSWNAEQNSGTFSIDSVVFIGRAFNEPDAPNTTTLSELKNEKVNQVLIYPNPLSLPQLHLDSEEAIKQVDLVSPEGRILWSQCFDPPEKTLNCLLPELEKGLYGLKMQMLNGSVSTRLLIIK